MSYSAPSMSYKQVTLNFSPELHHELQDHAAERGISVTELIKRAIALDWFIWEHRDSQLLLKDGDSFQEVIVEWNQASPSQPDPDPLHPPRP